MDHESLANDNTQWQIVQHRKSPDMRNIPLLLSQLGPIPNLSKLALAAAQLAAKVQQSD